MKHASPGTGKIRLSVLSQKKRSVNGTLIRDPRGRDRTHEVYVSLRENALPFHSPSEGKIPEARPVRADASSYP